MNKIYFLLLCLTIVCSAKTQSSYNEAMAQGDAAFANGEYKTAVNKYFAAQAYDPSKRDIVKRKVNDVFDKIEDLRQNALLAQVDANKARFQAEKALDDLKKQQAITKDANAKADSATNEMMLLKKTIIGAKYEGGIVFYWDDSTGRHGLIAAPNDLEGTFNWQKAKDTCKNLEINGYKDWHLPDKDELGALYANRNVIGGFQLALYWSTDEVNQAQSFCLSFDFGVKNNWAFKTSRFHVRPVRRF